MEYDKSIFAANLSRLMREHDKTQADICKVLGVSSPSVSAWCSGKKMPRMDKIEVLANYFGVMKSDLIEDKKELPMGQGGHSGRLTPEAERFIKSLSSLGVAEQERLLKIALSLYEELYGQRDGL